MKVQVGFYLITTLERYFPEDFNKFKVKQYGFRETLDALKLNKSFYETDKELQKLDNGNYYQTLKVCGHVSFKEFLDWEYIKYQYFCHAENTLGSITEIGHLESVSLSTDPEPDYHTGVQEIVNCYVSPIYVNDENELIFTDEEFYEKYDAWNNKWLEWLKDLPNKQNIEEDHPEFEV